jgi:tetratricopeptide (TPR) repeat protein
MSQELIEKGNILLKQNNFPEAGKIFHQLWEKDNNAYCASRYLYCLRKAGYPLHGLRQGEKAYSQFTNNIYIQRELVWIYYDIIKTFVQENNLKDAVKNFEEMLKLNPEQLPLELAIFLITNLAKQKNQWQIIMDICSGINPDQISNESPIINNHKVKSKREQYYFAYIKSLIELNHWNQVKNIAYNAITTFPKEMNFKRWYALALSHNGDIDKAISELEKIILKDRQEWYLFQDLSSLYVQKNQAEIALRYASKACLATKEHNLKVTLYQNVAEICLKMNQLELAVKHIQLSKLIRQQQGWKIKPEFEKLENNIKQKCQENNIKLIDYSFDELAKNCLQFWRKESYRGLQRHRGIIESIPQDKSFAWIRADNGDRIFFMQKELPPFLRKENFKVSFILEDSWDRKKNQLSSKAVDIRKES